MFLGSTEIKRLILEKSMIKGYRNLDEQLQPNGFDLTVEKIEYFTTDGSVWRQGKRLPLMKSLDDKGEWFGYDENDEQWRLPRGEYLITFNEEINLPKDIAAISMQRSTVMRCGAMTIVGSWDAGYNGKGCNLLIVANPEGFIIDKDARVVQMHFIPISGGNHCYNGNYQGENINVAC